MGATYRSDHNDFDIGWVNRVKVETPPWLDSYLPSDISPSDSGLSFIKTTGFMRSGYSGGPLVNLDGKVVGLTTKVFVETHKTGPEVEGASIPINFVKTIIDQLETKGKVERPFIGLSFVPTSMGLVVTHVQNDTPAQKAGIQPGDILIYAENTPLQNAEDLYRVIGFQLGSTIQVKAQRGGEAHVVEFKIQT
ncbi:unnamed protein product [Blepharisma stoltei]|uniref:PDZ domain-containing protein n=1 Tax=Blepharisma stoltei TaxID=1481888 RepID=A0AAU9JFF5_9CILI|nr:unnamed protein product [Blepharisma stoltei]